MTEFEECDKQRVLRSEKIPRFESWARYTSFEQYRYTLKNTTHSIDSFCSSKTVFEQNDKSVWGVYFVDQYINMI